MQEREVYERGVHREDSRLKATAYTPVCASFSLLPSFHVALLAAMEFCFDVSTCVGRSVGVTFTKAKVTT